MYSKYISIFFFLLLITFFSGCASQIVSKKNNTEKIKKVLITKKTGEDGNPGIINEAERTKRSFKNQIGQKFVYIEPGSFFMGGNNDDKDERPVHRVTLSSGFYMQATEVTQGQWLEIMGTRPWYGKKYIKENKDNPAVYISWLDAKEFARRLSGREGKHYQLPTEAQWEYACRAGSTSTYSFGNNEYNLGYYAWYKKNAWDVGNKYGQKVGTKKPNLWGLYNMHGNVYEWCKDWYGKNYYSSYSVTDPTGPSYGSYRVLRGVSWADKARSCRSSNRNRSKPGQRDSFTGFRLVCLSVQ